MRRFALLSCLLVPSVFGAAQPAAADTLELISHSTPYYTPASDLETVSIGNAARCDQSGWFGDIGFYILNPRFTNGNAAFAVAELAEIEGPIDNTATIYNFDHSNEFVPHFQIGYAGRNGLGIRGRWWTLDSSAFIRNEFEDALYLSANPGLGFLENGDLVSDFLGVEANHRLRMDVIDLEGIWSLDFARTSLLLSAGIRHAHVGQGANIFAEGFDTDNGFDPDFLSGVDSFHSFNGVGPTVSAQFNRMIGNTNLSIYGLSRGSLLIGEHRQSIVGGTLTPDNDSSVGLTNVSDGVLPVIELEVGGSYIRPTRHFDLFIEGGFVAMTWFNAGNATNSDALFGGYNASQNMHLTGLRFTGGVRF